MLFSDGTAYGGLSGSFSQGEILTLTLDFEKLQFNITGKNTNSTVSILKQNYWLAVQICGQFFKISHQVLL